MEGPHRCECGRDPALANLGLAAADELATVRLWTP